MVSQVTSLSRNGVSDWLIQRVSAYVLAAYTVFIVGYLLIMSPGYEEWSALFSQTWMQVASLVALIATCAHAWIGMWTIGTDYIREHYFGGGADSIRLIYQVVVVLALLSYLIWGVQILWG